MTKDALRISALKGFKDILPDEVAYWQHLEATARAVFHRFGFTEIKVPILEKTALFARSIGEVTDIVEKEMYTFPDRNGESVTLRPEGTASVLRAFVEHGLHVRQPVQRLYTIGPMFRHERPQKGRLRQFHQLSVELVGSDHPKVDAELMTMAVLLLNELGLNASLEINSLGCPECRPAYKEALVAFLTKQQDGLCPDCQRRSTTNPLRALDCKSTTCQEHYTKAPLIVDYLCPACDQHFQATQHGLQQVGLTFRVNPFMVRGLDYYTRTTFELLTDALGAQSAVGAGGRYDGLVEQLGGPPLPGIGFALGMERLILLLQQTELPLPREARTDIFLAALGNAAVEHGFQLVQKLRAKGARVAMDYEGRSLKSQLKQAGRLQARFTLILGDNELERGELVLKEMATGEQRTVVLDRNRQDWSHAVIEELMGLICSP